MVIYYLFMTNRQTDRKDQDSKSSSPSCTTEPRPLSWQLVSRPVDEESWDLGSRGAQFYGVFIIKPLWDLIHPRPHVKLQRRRKWLSPYLVWINPPFKSPGLRREHQIGERPRQPPPPVLSGVTATENLACFIIDSKSVLLLLLMLPQYKILHLVYS